MLALFVGGLQFFQLDSQAGFLLLGLLQLLFQLVQGDLLFFETLLPLLHLFEGKGKLVFADFVAVEFLLALLHLRPLLFFLGQLGPCLLQGGTQTLQLPQAGLFLFPFLQPAM